MTLQPAIRVSLSPEPTIISVDHSDHGKSKTTVGSGFVSRLGKELEAKQSKNYIPVRVSKPAGADVNGSYPLMACI